MTMATIINALKVKVNVSCRFTVQYSAKFTSTYLLPNRFQMKNYLFLVTMVTIRHVLLNTMGFYGKISLFISLEKHTIFLGFEVSSITLKIISILKNKGRISILFDSKNLR